MMSIQEFFTGLRFGELSTFENLAMLPVLADGKETEDPGYLLLDEAIRSGQAKVQEVGGGVVPELLFENLCDRPVLLVGGEELLGAKQNRIVNLTILAPPRAAIVIPVSCVEAGRWRFESMEMRPSESVAFREMRARSTAKVTASMRSGRSRAADQAEVWEDIERKSASLGIHSPTQAMRALFESRSSDIAGFVHALAWREGQTGAVFAIGGRPAGLDLFDHPRTCERILAKLVRGYALDAIEEQVRVKEQRGGMAVRPESPDPEDIVGTLREWIRKAAEAETFIRPAVGMGEDVRLEGAAVTGAALWAGERYVHVCAFPAVGARRGWATGSDTVAGPGWRRRKTGRSGGEDIVD
jgi:hypothetical protein